MLQTSCDTILLNDQNNTANFPKTERPLMISIKRKIVTDESMHPVAVMIDYADWIKIEQLLQDATPEANPPSLDQYAGTLSLNEDPIEYQQRIRREW